MRIRPAQSAEYMIKPQSRQTLPGWVSVRHWEKQDSEKTHVGLQLTLQVCRVDVSNLVCSLVPILLHLYRRFSLVSMEQSTVTLPEP